MTSFSEIDAVRENWQKHHVIPQAIRGDISLQPLFQQIALLGYEQDDFDTNGILLPSQQKEAISSGFSMHSGSHPKYSAFVKRILLEIQSEAANAILGNMSSADAYGHALTEVRGVQAFLIDSMTARVEVDQENGIRLGKALFSLNKPGLFADNDPAGTLDAALDEIYSNWDLTAIKTDDAYALGVNYGSGASAQFAAFIARDGSIYDPDKKNADGSYLDGAGRIEMRRQLAGEGNISQATVDASDLYSKLGHNSGLISVSSVVVDDYEYLASDEDYGLTTTELFTHYLPGLTTDAPTLAHSTAVFGQIGGPQIAGVALATFGSIKNDSGEATILNPLGQLTLRHFVNYAIALGESAEGWAPIKAVGSLLNLIPQTTVTTMDRIVSTSVNRIMSSNFPRLVLASGDMTVEGGTGGDIMTGSGRSNLSGGDGNDWMIHFGSGSLHGGDGNDKILALNSEYGGPGDRMDIYGDDGDDIVAFVSGKGGYAFGGAGDDYLWGGGEESHLYGGNGDHAGNDGEDTFFIGANTTIEDATEDDEVYFGPLPLVGGLKQWWMEGNKAYWAPLSSLLAAFPVIGSELIYAAAYAIDTPLMKFASYKLFEDGSLGINIGWGLGGVAAIKNYSIDLDTGRGTGGIAIFQANKATNDHGASVTQREKYVNLALYAGFGFGLGGYDPLVLDLDGDGLELRTQDNSPVYFEFDTDGFAEHTGWLRGDDGFLVVDANNNGKIDSVAEMFGSRTVTGFAALTAYDTNADAKIDANDTNFEALKIWRDLNQDGVTDAGELSTLTELGIASIGLANAAPTAPTAIGGNQVLREGTFTRTDGTTGKIADIALRISETDTWYMGDTNVSSSAAALPELAGFGELVDLRVAMTDDATLLSQVDNFVTDVTSNLATLKESAKGILFRWANVNGIAASSLGTNGFDTQKLAFLERLTGYQLMPRDSGGAIQLTNVAEMEGMWADQLTRLTLRLVVQGPLASDFSSIHYDAHRDLMIANSPTALADLLHARLAALPSGATAALAEWTAWAPLIGVLADGMVRTDGNVVRSDFLFAQLVRAMDGVSVPLSLAQLASGLSLDDTVIGTSGADTLTHIGTAETTTFYGQAGTDVFVGGGGQDVYVFGRNVGHATITDIENNAMGDRIRFAFLNQSDVRLVRDGDDLLVTVLATSETVRIVGQFAHVVPLGADLLLSTNKGVEEIQFADGSIMEIPEIMIAVGTGTSGDDHMIGTTHSDVLIGGLGDDLMEGGDDADLYLVRAGEGHDTIHEVQTTTLLRAADMVIFGDGLRPESLSMSRSGYDLLIATGGGNGVLIKDQFAYTSLGYNAKLAPNSRIEAFSFKDAGDTWGYHDIQQKLIAQSITEAADTTLGFGDDDDFAESGGNDLLVGYDGQDSYHWGKGSGNDTIDERAKFIDINVGLGGLTLGVAADTVHFTDGLTAADVVFSRGSAAPDLTITLTSTGETLTVKNQFAGYQTGVLGAQWMDRIEWFAFADGSAFSWQDVLAKITTGGLGNDTLTGDLYIDTLEGKGGNDFLSGKGYGDLYKFGLGDGQDVVQDANQFALGEGFITVDTQPDTLLFGAGITPGDIRFEHTGKDIKLIVGTGGESVLLKNQDDYLQTEVFGAISWDRIEQVKFADGTTWGWEELNQRVIAAGTTSGNDHTFGFTFEDQFAASAGNDILEGGDGSDTYAFGRGSGHDEIREAVSNVIIGDDDAVQFAAGVLPTDIALSRDGDDLIVTITDTGDTLRIKGEFDNYVDFTWTDVERFVFANGTVWTKTDIQNRLIQPTAGNDVITGFYTNDVLTGGAGNDTLRGRDGSDTYQFNLGNGQDRIEESVEFANIEDNDRVVFGAGIAPGDIILSRNGNDVTFSVSGTSDSLTIAGEFDQLAWFTWNDVETFEFANGTVWTKDDVAAKLLTSTPGDDTLNGTSANDRLEGGLGNDQLYGGDGSDTYGFAAGDGQDVIHETVYNAYINDEDRLVFKAGIAPTDLIYARDGDDLVITFTGSTDRIRIAGEFGYYAAYSWSDVERFEFADGTIVTKEEIQQKLIAGTAGNDHLIGYGSSDVFDGAAGDDILEGKDADDTYRFGRGDGHDTVRESLYSGASSENDTLEFKTGILPTDVTINRDGQDAVFTLDTGETIRVEGQFNEGYNEFLSNNDVEEVKFADGTIWDKRDVATRSLHATAGNDTLAGTRYDETIDGFGGNDLLQGNGGNDTLRGGLGDDRLEGSWGNDTYVYSAGDGADVIYDYNYGNDEADRLVFGPGITAANLVVTSNPSDSNEMRISFNNGPGSITVTGQWWNDGGIEFIDFADGTTWTLADMRTAFVAGQTTTGNDLIYGTGDVDTINGGAGNDSIYSFGGNDVLTGGAGDDRLEGEYGDDRYIYALGDGNDVIADGAYWGNGVNTLAFGAGILPTDIRLSNVAGDMSSAMITFAGQPGSIKLQSEWYDVNGVERFEFANGTVWTDTQLAGFYVAQQTTSGNDLIHGTMLADSAVGAAGDDSIYSWNGNDDITGGLGNDQLEGAAGDDTYHYSLGDGADVINDYDYWGNGNNTLAFGGGISSSDILVSRIYGNSVDMRITFKNAEGSIRLTGQDWWNGGINQITFAGGGSLSDTQLTAMLLSTTNAADVYAGTAAADTIYGLEGDDQLSGLGGNDAIDGGDGADTIYGDTAGGVSPTGSNLLTNGSFETSGTVVGGGWWGIANTDLPGWTKSNSQTFEQVYSGIQGVTASDGSLWLDMDSAGGSGSNMDISQTVTGLTAGEVMMLRFDHSNRTGWATGSLEVLWNGTSVGTYNDVSAAMVTTTLSLTAVAGSNVVTFRGLGNEDSDGAALDNVRLHATSVATTGDDTLHGGNGNDAIYGGGGDDTIGGGSGSDTLFGEDGADRITGGAGNDALTGGNGYDVAVFAGGKTSYSLVTSGGTTTIVDNAQTVDGDDGTDTLVGIEKAEFAGGEQVGIAAPIIIDLNGDGVHATGLDQSTTYFDWDGDGIADRTAWVGGGDAFLTLDRDGDGTVSGASELSFTGDKKGAKSDLDGLTAFDSDQDGALTAGDARWSSFHLWADGNGNGIVGTGEYRTLADAGITSISLGGQAVDRAWGWGEVVTINSGTAGLTGGGTAAFSDVALTYEVAGSNPSFQKAPEDWSPEAWGSSPAMQYDDGGGYEDIALIGGQSDLRSFARASRLSQSIASFGAVGAAGVFERGNAAFAIEREQMPAYSHGGSGGRHAELGAVHLL